MLLLLLSMLGGAYVYRSRQLAQVRTMRLKIASDLHDDIGANLNAIALKSDLLRRRPERVDPTRVTQSLSDIQRLANDTMQKVREMIWVVKSEHDTVESLIARMQDVASTMVRGITEIRFSVDDPPKVQIPMEVRQDAYLGFKEAIQNVIRHSGSSEVLVRVEYEAPQLHISVTDDGVGFDPDRVTRGNGLAMLEQRAGRNGTRFAIHSEEGRGTTVCITVRVG
jgi:signal transduction histidine kinase